jgi:triacylglycerol esterase/lipase EstA (alpha/beta hydrolase family)
VILVHGTFGDRKHLLERMSRKLKEAGFCVYSLDYGNRATRDIRQSAQELKAYVERVLASTGAAKVSMVGHSQGGLMPRYYIKYLGGDQYVDDLVGVAPSNHGGTNFTAGIDTSNPVSQLFGQLCESCLQQNPGSTFLTDLNAGDETPGDVSYTQITTRYDEIVLPHTSGYLTPGPRTTNLTIQNICWIELSEHVLIPSSMTTIRITLDALNRQGPARQDYPRGC